MHTVNSLSGGKTSSYMAAHYPADYNVFALVRIEDPRCTPKDESLVRFVSDKIGTEFIATAESDTTLYAMRDLEQLIGKEIIWVTGKTFEQTNKWKGNGLPNQEWRFCTTEMKMRPIFDWWFKTIGEKVRMGVGFRYDEKERAERLTTSFKGIVGKRKTRNKWATLEWREGYFPLIEDKINHIQVRDWALGSGLTFPPDSNCVGCFWKQVQQLRKNWEDEPNKMQWFADQESSKKRWKKEMTYEQVKRVGLQQDFFFGTGSGCQAGFCTDQTISMPAKKCPSHLVPEPSEYDLQKSVCQYLRLQYPELIFTSDLSGIRMPIGLAVKTSKLRSSKSIPDLLIFEARKGYHGLFIELKRPGVKFFKKDGITPATEHFAEQWEMVKRLNTKGYLSAVADSYEKTVAIIDSYMSENK